MATVMAGQETSVKGSQWEDGVRSALLSCDEAAERDDTRPHVSSWVSLAQNGALVAHSLILEDGPGLLDSSIPVRSDLVE
jgi:hypothetical protein